MKEYPWKEYLTELRYRICYVFLGMFVGTFVGYYSSNEVLYIVLKPLLNSQFFGQSEIYNEFGFKEEVGKTLVSTSPSEILILKIKWSVLVSLYANVPLIWIQVYSFFAPGMVQEDQLKLRSVSILNMLSLYLSSQIVLFVILPIGLDFLYTFLRNGGSINGQGYIEFSYLALTGPYLEIVLILVGLICLVYQFPLVLFLISKCWTIPVKVWVRWRGVFWFCSCFVGTFLSPPDIFSQLIVSILCICMFEVFLAQVFINEEFENMIYKYNKEKE